MKHNEFKEEIENAISEYRFGDVITNLEKKINRDRSVWYDFLHLKMKFEKISKEKNQGIVRLEDESIEISKISLAFLTFIKSLKIEDVLSSEREINSKRRVDTYKAIGKFEEIKVPKFAEDFKSKHLIEGFNYLAIDNFTGDMYEIEITREDDFLSFVGNQAVKFRKNISDKEPIIVHETIFGKGSIIGEYGYVDYYTKPLNGVVSRHGKLILNISNADKMHGYFITPDIELSGVIALIRVEITLLEKIDYGNLTF